jgi:hypothetical protein
MKYVLKENIVSETRYVKMCLPVFFKNNDMPRDFPLREGTKWEAIVEVDTGQILNWTKGYPATVIFLKVIDAGTYYLLDKDLDVIAKLEGYVPNTLIPERNGWGDYVELHIDSNGVITNWYDNPDYSAFLK